MSHIRNTLRRWIGTVGLGLVAGPVLAGATMDDTEVTIGGIP